LFVHYVAVLWLTNANRYMYIFSLIHRRRFGAEFGGQKNFEDQNLSMTIRKKFHFEVQNFWWPFFNFQVFLSLLSEMWYITCMYNYGLFLTRKTSISEKNPWWHLSFTQFVLSHASDNNSSRNIGGTDAWAITPTSNLGGTVPPVPLHVSLLPWFNLVVLLLQFSLYYVMLVYSIMYACLSDVA